MLAIAMPQVIVDSASISSGAALQRLTIYQHGYAAQVAVAVSGGLVLLRLPHQRALDIVDRRLRILVTEPLHDFEEAHRFSGVGQLRGDGRAGTVACNFAAGVEPGIPALRHSSGIRLLLR